MNAKLGQSLVPVRAGPVADLIDLVSRMVKLEAVQETRHVRIATIGR